MGLNETATRPARTRQHGMGAFRQCRRDALERAEGRIRQAGKEAEETAGKEAGRTAAELTAHAGTFTSANVSHVVID